METQVLKFFTNHPDAPPLRASLDLDKFERVWDEKKPAAYLVKQQDLAALKKFQDLIVDRGKKDKRKDLSTLLLGQEKIPLIDGDYAAPGQCNRSIRTLLANAKEKEERNLYIIGAGEDIFNSLWEQAGLKKKTPDLADLADGRTSLPSFILELMETCEEPLGLSQRFLGESAEAKLVRRLILLAAQTDATVLILGDSGTGKELAAQAIHDYSQRGGKNFIPVNCGAIPAELFESALFGHKKGSFTGALDDKIGMWKLADGGTLFLDEIGDLAQNHQVKILRALQEGKILPIGETREISVNARVIAATNRDLFSMVQAKQFREDLYYRLREFLMRTPALRNHQEDIPRLAQRFWKRITGDEKSSLPSPILRELQFYRWPGNAREIKAVLTHMRTLFPTPRLRIEHLRAVFLLQGQTMPAPGPTGGAGGFALHEMESLGHLRRVEEVIRATEFAINSLLESSQLDKQDAAYIQHSVRFRLHELESCMQPLRSNDVDDLVSAAVNPLEENLLVFQSRLEKNPKEAKHYWKKEVVRTFHHALASIAREVKLLMRGTS